MEPNMSILSDISINARCTVFTDLCEADDRPHVGGMISPFHARQIKQETRCGQVVDLLSYGLSSYGYDVRLDIELEIFTNINNASGDPKRPSKGATVKAEVHKDEFGASYAWLPANSFMLGHTMENFRIPRDVLVICLGKSTYARAGIIVNVTPLEPEWEGYVVLELSNTTSIPQKIYVMEGVAQFLFLEGDMDCHTSYKDRGGKYQGQSGITHGKV
jgi:dCTP deaminase